MVNTFSERCEVSDFEKSITQINADDKHYFVFIMSHLSTPNTRTDVNSSMSAWSLKSYINLTFSKIYEEKKGVKWASGKNTNNLLNANKLQDEHVRIISDGWQQIISKQEFNITE